MLNEIRPFFDHSRHTLWVRNLDAPLDVLAFVGEEALSQPFDYRIEFTSTQKDIPADQLLGQDARFSLCPPPTPVPFIGMQVPPTKPLRTLHGVVTHFRRLAGSNDEARYEVTLQPRLALLGRGRQYRIYQHQSVPEIVEGILRSRHDFEGQDFFFDLKREYPKREQVMQYGESDLAFIQRLLADIGIWYRFTADERLNIDVVEFHDDQRNYQFDVILPLRPQSGTSSSGQDAVWQLQSHHGVVEKNLHNLRLDLAARRTGCRPGPGGDLRPGAAAVLHRQPQPDRHGRGRVGDQANNQYVALGLPAMLGETSAATLFDTPDSVPGAFTRQAWEGYLRTALDQAAETRREELDWVLSDPQHPLALELQPEALKARLSERYFQDFSAAWLDVLNSIRWHKAASQAEAIGQLALLGDTRQSPLVALMNTLAYQGMAGLTAGPDKDPRPRAEQDIDLRAPMEQVFGPVLALLGKGDGASPMFGQVPGVRPALT